MAVLWPFSRTRRSLCQRTARESANASASWPTELGAEAASGVVELLVLDDVAAVLEEERADRGDDARTLPAAQREGERVGHRCLFSTRRR
jgi:hypothetical protein